ncbi:MAG: hypothetical protein GC189_01140 [Alphaproteobacteria bacterium]|nr:hypothetical protein [Alphaproteobacteria bacterium]
MLDLRARAVRPPTTIAGFAALALLFLTLSVVVNGIGFTDLDLPQLWAARSFEAVPAEREFVLMNWLYAAFGRGLTALNAAPLSDVQFKLASVALAGGAIAALMGLALQAYGASRATVFLGAVCLTGLDYTLLHWMGKTDALVVAGYAVVFFARRNSFVSAAGYFLLFAAHAEQAALISAGHAIMLILRREAHWRDAAAFAAGAGLALAAGQIYALAIAMGDPVSRAELLPTAGPRAFENMLHFRGIALVSVLWGGWALAFSALRDARAALLIGLSLALAMGVAAFTYDFTRVAVLLTLPLTFHLADVCARAWRDDETMPLPRAALLTGIALIGFEVIAGGVRGAANTPGLSALAF